MAEPWIEDLIGVAGCPGCNALGEMYRKLEQRVAELEDRLNPTVPTRPKPHRLNRLLPVIRRRNPRGASPANMVAPPEYQTDYGVLMAGTLLAVLPVIVLFFAMQRDFIAGLASGAVKG